MGSGTNDSAGLRDYLRVVRRRKWIILQAVALVPAAAIAFSMHQTKEYRATSQVLLVQQNVANQLNDLNDPGQYQQADRRAQTQADLARVPKVVQRTLHLAGISMSTEDFLASSSVTAKTNADLLQLSVTNHERELAKRLATAYGEAYARYRSDLDTAPYVKAREHANRQLADMRVNGQQGTPAYADLTAKRDEIDQVVALMTQNAVPVENADTATQVQPRPVRNGILGLALGIVLGVALAFLREALDTRVRTSEEIGEQLGIPLLARIPEPPRKLRRSDKLAMLVEPDGKHAEPFRMLRTNLDFVRLGKNVKSIVVTSAVEKEGKSTTAANLAVALARAGQRVALLDLDLRRPYQGNFFAVEDQPGITQVALGHEPLERALVPLVISGRAEERVAKFADSLNGKRNGNGASSIDASLVVIPTGPLPPNPGEFAGSSAIEHILNELADRFDTVLIDAPPALQVGDAMALSRHADATVVVTRMNLVRKPMLGELRRMLDASPAEKLGFILTGAEAEDGYSGGYYYYASKTKQPVRENAEVPVP